MRSPVEGGADCLQFLNDPMPYFLPNMLNIVPNFLSKSETFLRKVLSTTVAHPCSSILDTAIHLLCSVLSVFTDGLEIASQVLQFVFQIIHSFVKVFVNCANH